MAHTDAIDHLRGVMSLLINRRVLEKSAQEEALKALGKVKAYIAQVESYDSTIINSDKWRLVLIKDLKLTNRTYNCLKQEGIENVGDILDRSIYKLKRVRGFGPGALIEIEDALAERGLVLKAWTDFSG